MTILGCDPDKPREIGQRYTGVWHGETLHPDQPFVVLRQATREEYMAERGWESEACSTRDLSTALFYEVSLD